MKLYNHIKIETLFRVLFESELSEDICESGADTHMELQAH